MHVLALDKGDDHDIKGCIYDSTNPSRGVDQCND